MSIIKTLVVPNRMKSLFAILAGVGFLLLWVCAQPTHGTPLSGPPPLAEAAQGAPPAPPPVRLRAAALTRALPRAASPLQAVVGEPLTYTLTVVNRGPSDASGVLVTDTLPAGVQFVSATASQGDGCRLTGLIVCALGDLRLGSRATITVVVIPLTTTGTLSHAATLRANEPDPNAADNRFDELIRLKPTADLALRAPSPGAVPAGSTVIYNLTVENHGPALATGVVLTAVLPAGLTPLWTRPGQPPTCGRQGAFAGCDFGDLRGGDAVTVTLDITRNITDTLITGAPRSGVTLDVSAATCLIGADGPLPLVSCHLGRLAQGENTPVLIGAQAAAGVTGTLTHTVSVSAYEPDPLRANNQSAFTTTVGATTSLTASLTPTAADLRIHVAAPARIVAGVPFTYTLTVTNAGALPATGVTLVDTPPPGLALEAMRPGWPVCDEAENRTRCFLPDPRNRRPITFTLLLTGPLEGAMVATLDPLAPGWPVCRAEKNGSLIRAVNCNLDDLQSGESTQVTLVALARGVLVRAITNTVSVAANEPELNPLDNTAVLTANVDVLADLTLRSTLSGTVRAGKTLTYLLTVTNTGPSNAIGVVLTDTLPLSATLASANASRGKGCAWQPGGASVSMLVCDLGRLYSGDVATVTITVRVDLMAATPSATLRASSAALAHTAAVWSDQPDPQPANNTVAESMPVVAEADLSIEHR